MNEQMIRDFGMKIEVYEFLHKTQEPALLMDTDTIVEQFEGLWPLQMVEKFATDIIYLRQCDCDDGTDIGNNWYIFEAKTSAGQRMGSCTAFIPGKR